MTESTSQPPPPRRPHIVFIHLDLGIGGAEQLVVNLALASLGPSTLRPAAAAAAGRPSRQDERQQHSPTEAANELNARVTIYTTHCSPTHCFDVVKPPNGVLSESVEIRGSWLPTSVPLFVFFGPRVGTALCSTLRMVWLSYVAAKECGSMAGGANGTKEADVFVVDVLPTGIPMLVCWWMAKSCLFYCHFPDKLLTRDTVNGVVVGRDGAAGGQGGGFWLIRLLLAVFGLLKSTYRRVLDAVEEHTMRYADLIAVNSNFTRKEVSSAFPTLTHPATSTTNRPDDGYVQVLYPPIDLEKFIEPNFADKESKVKAGNIGPIVSLNRFERKKNVGILLQAYAELRRSFDSDEDATTDVRLPKLVIAGGYDPRNVENVEHLVELQALASDLGIERHTTFQPSVGDDERADLLRGALCVAYTPHREHFGIVPLEAMYAGSPVVAVNSGGPRETVVHGRTGWLVENTVDGFVTGLRGVVEDPTRAVEMGRAGHERVRANFGLDTFRARWVEVVKETVRRGQERRRRWEGGIGLEGKRLLPRWAAYMSELVMALLFAVVLTLGLRAMGLLGPTSSVWGEVKRVATARWSPDEL